MKLGHGKFTNIGGGALEKSASDGMIESASMDMKNELKRAKNCTKRFETIFIYFGLLNVAFGQLVVH